MVQALALAFQQALGLALHALELYVAAVALFTLIYGLGALSHTK